MRETGDIRNVAVIGGGYVGRGVALQFALADFRVLMFNRSPESAARARAEIAKALIFLSMRMRWAKKTHAIFQSASP